MHPRSSTGMLKQGLTLIEILISVAILGIVIGVITNIFISFNRHQALERDRDKVISVLERARQLTLFSLEGSQYGVRLDDSSVTLFRGSTYNMEAEDNSLTKLHSVILISDYSLNGGGDDIIFERLTGETNQHGTITLESRVDTSNTKIITIEETGLAK